MGEERVSGENSGDVITARIVITFEDLTAAWDALAAKRRKVTAATVLGVVAFFWLWPVLQGEAQLAWAVAGGVVFLVTGVALVGSFFRTRSSWARQTLVQSRAAEGVEFMLDRQAFGFKGPGREGRVEWSVLWGHLETADAFLIIIAPRAVNVIPKRAFAAEDLPRIRGFLSNIVSKRAPRTAVSPLRLVGFIGILCFLAFHGAEWVIFRRMTSSPVFKTHNTERYVRSAVELWRIKSKTTDCPTLAQLVDSKALTARNTVDSWGRPLQLRCDGPHFSVRSAGPDGQLSNFDDAVMTDQHTAEEASHFVVEPFLSSH